MSQWKVCLNPNCSAEFENPQTGTLRDDYCSDACQSEHYEHDYTPHPFSVAD